MQDKAQNLLGLNACPAPFLLPTSCSNGQSPSTKGLNVRPFLASPRPRALAPQGPSELSMVMTRRRTGSLTSFPPPRVKECCTNVPGGLQLQTQFWNAQPDIGPESSWSVHGLWPDNCDGSYEQYCDPSREYTNIRQILTDKGETDLLAKMDVLWKSNTDDDESLWVHEWGKVRSFLAFELIR